MLKLHTYAGFSFVAALAAIYHAFNSRQQFYPAMAYLSTSNISLTLLVNLVLVIMLILWHITKRVFLGPLREPEVERLNEQSWREVTEILFTITMFRQDLSVSFVVMVTVLLMIKALHWLGEKRIEYIETTPSVNLLSHIRIVSFMLFLLGVDTLLFYTCATYLIQKRLRSIQLFFAFEYLILATTTISAFVKYVFYVRDMRMEGQWERKAVYTFYLELITDLLQLSTYICYFLVIFMNYGVPLNLIREFYMTFRTFKVRVADYIRYREITSNMNDRFPDASPEELNADATCIICREEMITAKKLICGHSFHMHCLRSWLERQHTCPTCRAIITPPENATSASGVQRGLQVQAHQQGASTQSMTNGAADDVLSRHQARLEAASTAASLYAKSYVCPSENSLMWSQHYANLQHHQFPSTPGSQLEAQERFILDQIEILQGQLQLLQLNNRGKAAASSSS